MKVSEPDRQQWIGCYCRRWTFYETLDCLGNGGVVHIFSRIDIVYVETTDHNYEQPWAQFGTLAHVPILRHSREKALPVFVDLLGSQIFPQSSSQAHRTAFIVAEDPGISQVESFPKIE